MTFGAMMRPEGMGFAFFMKIDHFEVINLRYEYPLSLRFA